MYKGTAREYKNITDMTKKLKTISNNIKSLSKGQGMKVRGINQEI